MSGTYPVGWCAKAHGWASLNPDGTCAHCAVEDEAERATCECDPGWRHDPDCPEVTGKK